MTTYLDLSGYPHTEEPTEAELEQFEASWSLMMEFANRVHRFIDHDYKAYAVAKAFPELPVTDEKTLRFWERLMAHVNLRAYISQRIAERTGIQGTGKNWAEIEDFSVPENPTDAATEDIFAEIDDAVATEKEQYIHERIVLVLDANRLYNRDFPSCSVILSPDAVKIITNMRKVGTPIDAICKMTDCDNKRAIRQAIYRLNQRIRGNLKIDGNVIIGDRNGDGYRWIKSVSIDLKNQAT